ncbi:hypothetical protein V6N13_109329 [Hibiscus sabdariffa]|uniref:Uncharacterized protein n=1 Tax=Hibiscus sabdariffa TaxID=183260 RepID=A0ABR2FPQ2_9ROSI
MEKDSGTWSCSNCGTWSYFDKWMVETVEDQVPLDYEQEVQDPRHCGRVRCCHALLDSRSDPDLVKLCNLFCQNLFEQSPKFIPWEHEIPGWFKVCRDWEIFNYIKSMCREGRNKNVYKFLIVVKFGLFMDGNDHEDFSDDDESDLEVESEEVSAS